jgi:hypothetical protein
LLHKQVKIGLKKLVQGKSSISSSLHPRYRKIKDLGLDYSCLHEACWSAYAKTKENALTEFQNLPSKGDGLLKPLDDLVAYFELARCAGWKDQEQVIIQAIKDLVHYQMATILNRLYEIEFDSNKKKTKYQNQALEWNHFFHGDWVHGICSITLLSYDKYFCQTFGNKKILLERAADRLVPNYCYSVKNSSYSGQKRKYVHELEFQVEHGIIVPNDKGLYGSEHCIQDVGNTTPQSLQNVHHWGHYLRWKVCEFLHKHHETTK